MEDQDSTGVAATAPAEAPKSIEPVSKPDVQEETAPSPTVEGKSNGELANHVAEKSDTPPTSESPTKATADEPQQEAPVESSGTSPTDNQHLVPTDSTEAAAVKTPSPKKATKRKGLLKPASPSEEEQSQPPKKPLFEVDVVVADGQKRERKKVSRFSDQLDSSHKQETQHKDEIPSGSGVRLGEIPRVNYFLQRADVSALKLLHSIIFGRPGGGKELKGHLRAFNGFAFDQDSAEFKTKLARLKQKTMKDIKNAAKVFEVSGKNRDELAEHLLQAMLKPTDSGQPIPKSKHEKKGRPSSGSGRKPKSASATSKRRSTEDSKADSSDSVSSTSSSSSSSESESESEEEETKKKSKKSPKKKSPKKEKKEKVKEKVSPKKSKTKEKESKSTPSKKASSSKSPAKKKQKTPDTDDSKRIARVKKPQADVDNSSSKGPTDDEIKQVIQDILSHADLETTTMKTVSDQVCGRFPGIDLTERKQFIRQTVKALISSSS